LIRLAPLKLWLVLLSFAAFASIARGQDSQSQQPSLGDVARQARAAKSSAPKSTVVLDDDNMPKSKGGVAGGGQLSPDKQSFCDELRQRKDPMAEYACSILAIDMGTDYENMTARGVELTKSLCAANGGHLPASEPKDPSLAAQCRELRDIGVKLSAMMQEHMNAFRNSESAVNAVREEKYREEDAQLPDWRNNAAMMANPEEKKRFFEIEEKYRSREQEKEKAAAQERERGLRYLYDTARLQEICGGH
jgi:hypothetical protein